MKKIVCVLAAAALLGNASLTVSLADVTGQTAQLVGPGGQENNSAQQGGGPGNGQMLVEAVPDQGETGGGDSQNAADPGQSQTGAGGSQNMTDPGQGQTGIGGGQNAAGPGQSQSGGGNSQNVTGPGAGQNMSGPGSSQNPMDPGYYSLQLKNQVGPGGEENGDGTVQGAPQISQNNFLDAVIMDPIVKVAEKYSYDQMVWDIQQLQVRYGEKIHVNVIGRSHDGRDIYEIIVGNVNAPKHILLQGAIHAREYMTPLLMMNQVETALYHYDTGQYGGFMLRDMFQQTALHFIPMSNPDGVTLSQFGLAGLRSDFLKQAVLNCYARDMAEGRTALPIEQYLPLWKSNAMGVDLNHNFAADWDGIVTTATANSYAGYKGTAPLSEPESQALASMADKYVWAATISYHSMGNIIYWDTQISRVKDASLSLAQSVSSVTGYRLDGSDGKGGFKDWMQAKDNPVPGITIEVGSVSCPLPVSQYESIWQQNKAVWAQVLRWSIGG